MKIGLSLMRQYNVKSQLVILQFLYHVFISFWKEPLQATCEALIDIHQDALMEGKSECSVSSALNLCRQNFMSGVNLQKLSVDCKSVTHKMVSVDGVWGSHAAIFVLLLISSFCFIGATQASLEYHVPCQSSLFGPKTYG